MPSSMSSGSRRAVLCETSPLKRKFCECGATASGAALSRVISFEAHLVDVHVARLEFAVSRGAELYAACQA